MATFGEQLQALRQKRNLTQAQVAIIFDMTERAYRRYENNQSTPHYETLASLADYFRVSVDYLMGRTDDMDTTVFSIQTKAILSDNRLSLDTKCLYLQFCYLAIQGKVQIFNEDEFCKEYGISRKEFDGIIKELADLGYLRIERGADERSGSVYVLEENSVNLEPVQNLHKKL